MFFPSDGSISTLKGCCFSPMMADLSRALELPSTGWLRRYRVRAHGSITQEKLDTLKDGIAVDGVFYGAIEATLEREQGSNVWIMVGLARG